jgi:class 3 adenylate cyclase
LVIFIGLIAYLTYRNAQAQKAQNKIIEAERAKSEKLLLNILPKEIAQELKEKGETEVRLFSHASILFADVKGFSKYAGKVTPQVLVNELDLMFTEMDNYTTEHKMERIKTIGDCYMAVAGCPEANKLKIQHWMESTYQERGGNFWQVRLGIHTGELVAGVVGKLKFAYDVWGGAVNIASRLESGGIVGKVNTSEITYNYIKDFFDCTYGGEIEAKNIGTMKTYIVNNLKPELAESQQAVIPNAKFWEMYQARFA